MSKRFYLVTRDLHLYLGLFISPFVLVFAISVFFLVHSWIPGGAKGRAPNTRAAAGLQLPPNLEQLSDRDRVNALRGVLDQAGVKGEVIFIRYVPKEHRLVVPVTVPGRETTVDINLETRIVTIEERSTGLWDAVVVLHKLPGPHGGDIRMNWVYLRIWRWLADATSSCCERLSNLAIGMGSLLIFFLPLEWTSLWRLNMSRGFNRSKTCRD
jgi:hypothetical protein